ncbi:MAG: outer membrane lipoprotein-sorting protein, partial [Bacteroidia bacterium]
MKAFVIIIFIPLCFCFLGFYSFIPKDDAKEIVRKSDEKMRGKTSRSEVTIQIVRPTWTREIKMKTWSKGSNYALILVTAPAREKGTVYLKRDKEVWNWIPSIERTIKLPPSMMSQSWMGTDFT